MALLALVALAGLIIISPGKPVYDEHFYIDYAHLLDRDGLSQQWLRDLPGTPGPVIGLVHYAAKRLTGLRAPAVRWVSFVLFLAIIGVLYRSFRHSGHGYPAIGALSIMAVPTIWPVAGLALSDVPAILLVAISADLMLAALKPEQSMWRYWLPGSVALGLAALDRQNALAVCAAPVLSALETRRHGYATFVFVLVVGAIVLPIFVLWRGLVPPGPLHVPMGFSPGFGVLAFGYLGLTMLILAPGFFPVRVLAILGVIVVSALGAFSPFFHAAPMMTVAMRLGEPWFSAYSWVASTGFLGLAIYTAYAILYRMYESRNPSFRLSCIAVLAITATSFAVHSYSSRYTILCVPFILLMLEPFAPVTIWRAARIGIGAILGALSLYAYYSPSTPIMTYYGSG